MGTLGFLGTTEIVVIVLVVLLLFGGKKIPELMRGVGKGVRSFKEGVNGIEEEMKRTTFGLIVTLFIVSVDRCTWTYFGIS